VCRVKKFDKKKRRKRHDSTDSDEETAHLVYWDTRCLSSPLGSIKDFHSEDIVDVKFDPTSISGYPRLLDCSHDGLVCLYNMQAAAALQDNTLLYVSLNYYYYYIFLWYFLVLFLPLQCV
ncbi:unnamed protein product, partial [Trichobilharzia regenti]